MTWTTSDDVWAAMRKGQRYLKGLQRADGGWGWPENDYSEAWGTAECILATCFPKSEYELKSSLSWLRNSINSDGGWSSEAYRNLTHGLSDVAATTYAMRALASCGNPEDRLLIERGREWLVKTQRSDGSWGVFRPNETRGHIGQTGYAISAIARAPVEHRAAEAVQSALYFLYDNQKSSGGWSLIEGNEIDSTITAYAVRGIIDVAALRGQPAQPRLFLNWFQNAQETQHNDGSWSDWYGNFSSVESTGYFVEIAVSLGCAGGSFENFPRSLRLALNFLAMSQHSSGGWGPNPSELPAHWVTHSVVIALGTLLGQTSALVARLPLLSEPPKPGRVACASGAAYDFAISFASSQRAYARALALKLQQRGASVFFDSFETGELWGVNLVDRFTHIYNEESRLCIVIVSQDYADRAWPKLERQSAQARALTSRIEYILPILKSRDVKVPGLLDTTGYLDAERYDVDEIAALAMAKLRRVSTNK